MGLLKKYRATTLEKVARNMRTMKSPDRISSKYFMENRTIFMRFQTPTGRKTAGRKIDNLPPPGVLIYFAASTTFS
jgi:hypothetical protein